MCFFYNAHFHNKGQIFTTDCFKKKVYLVNIISIANTYAFSQYYFIKSLFSWYSYIINLNNFICNLVRSSVNALRN